MALLEALADAEPADIIMRPPGTSDELVAVPDAQKQALAVLKALGAKAA